MTYTLRDYQRAAVDSINTYFRAHPGKLNPVLVEPTGAGKSIIIATYIDELFAAFPSVRVLCLTHSKELLVQNAGKLREVNPELDIGIYSAGLGLRQMDAQFLFGGIQSIHRKDPGPVDICLVDEAHLINTKEAGIYRKFINRLRERKPRMPVVGFTATPYRLGSGMIYAGKDALFDGVAHETPIEMLIDRGYLVPPIAKSSDIHADLSHVGHNSRGEFKEAEMAEAFSEITGQAVDDMIHRARGRACRLVFCSGVKHAQDVVRALMAKGETSVGYLDGKTKEKERDALLRDVVAGRVAWVVNVGVLTTGFDAPIIDCVVLLRATESTGIYVQIIGRGLRILDGKENCLVLDYGANTARHGPLNCLRIDQKDGPPPTKNCDQCDTIVGSGCAECPDCGFVWLKDCPSCEGQFRINLSACDLCGYRPLPGEETDPNHETRAAEEELIVKLTPVWKRPKKMVARPHRGKSGVQTMRVDYLFGFGQTPAKVSEWVCFDHSGYAKSKAEKWAALHGGAGPYSVAEACDVEWICPFALQIQPKANGYYEVLDRSFVDVNLGGK